MFLEELSKILQFISAFLLILFSVIILMQKRGLLLPRVFLSGFFISRAIIILCFASYYYYELLYIFPDIFVMGEPFLFLYAPFLYLYTRSVSTNNARIRWYDGFHFIPFLLVLIYLLLNFHFAPKELKIQMLQSEDFFNSIFINGTLLWIQFAVYAVACIYLLIRYKRRIVRFNSTYDHQLLTWLNFLVGAFLLWKAIFVSGYIFGIFKGGYAYIFQIFIELGFLFYASMLAFKGLQMPHVVLSLKEEKAYKTSTLTAKDRQSMLAKLENVIRAEKPYLNPSLTLNDLAVLCEIPVHHLSQILNEDIKHNFYNYINSLRIEEAKNILADPKNKALTILEVLYSVGFNSKSVFNTSFKKHVKMTPTEFRKKMIRSNAA
jgi:AraC-like DNA-binding protein